VKDVRTPMQVQDAEMLQIMAGIRELLGRQGAHRREA
jgi:hypothetical protein